MPPVEVLDVAKSAPDEQVGGGGAAAAAAADDDDRACRVELAGAAAELSQGDQRPRRAGAPRPTRSVRGHRRSGRLCLRRGRRRALPRRSPAPPVSRRTNDSTRVVSLSIGQRPRGCGRAPSVSWFSSSITGRGSGTIQVPTPRRGRMTAWRRIQTPITATIGARPTKQVDHAASSGRSGRPPGVHPAGRR